MDEKRLQDYRDFLLKVLQAIHDSNSDPRVVYPLLQANLDKLDKRLPTVLRSWATATLYKVEPQKARYMAALIGHFSNLVQQFSQRFFRKMGSNTK
jgi:hypothetical protein